MSRIDFYATGYGKHAGNEPRVTALFRLLGDTRSPTFLDIGCGDGSLTVRVARHLGASDIHGCDISAAGVASACTAGVQALEVDIDCNPLPYPSGLFPFVLCTELIEHVFDPDALVKEVARVLSPGGLLLLTTPNVAAWHSRLQLLLGFQPNLIPVAIANHDAGRVFRGGTAGREHVRFFTHRALLTLLERNHLRVVKSVGAHTTPAGTGKAGRIIAGLDALLSHVETLATYSCVLARKG